MNILDKIRQFFKKASRMTNGDYKSSGTVSGAAHYGYYLIKSIFNKDFIYYRCPTCYLTISKNAFVCPRCGTRLNWNQVK